MPGYIYCNLPSTPSKGAATTLCEAYGGGTIDVEVGQYSPGQFDHLSSYLESIGLSGATSFSLAGMTIKVSGPFEVDVDLSLTDCIVITTGGTRIGIGQGKSFICDNVKIFSCDLMWEGIEPRGDNVITMKNDCIIEDAAHAFNFDEAVVPSTVLFNGLTFNRNYIGIHISKAMGTSSGVLDLTGMDNVKFTCTSDLSSENSDLVPENSTISWCGILSDNSLVTIGRKGTVTADFDGLIAGIRSNGSVIRVRGGCKFLNMVRPNAGNSFPPGYSEGWGIISYNGSNIDVGVSTPNQFVNNQYGGIFSYASSLTANNSLFDGNSIGILAQANGTAQRLWVINNHAIIRPGGFQAFDLTRSRALTGVSRTVIKDNHIERMGNTNIQDSPYPLSACWLRCAYPGVTDRATVQGNRFDDFSAHNMGFNDSDVGFFLTGGLGLPTAGSMLRVADNDVVYHNTNNTNKFGFSFSNLPTSTGMEVQGNTATMSGEDQSRTLGMYFQNVQSAEICENSVDNFDVGMEFWGTCSPSGFRSNHFLQGRLQGWAVTGQGGLGAQVRTGNTWSTTPQPSFYKDAVSEVPVLTPYITVSNDPSIFPPINWFDIMSGPTSYVCLTSTSGSGGASAASQLSSIDAAVLDGSIHTFGLSAPRQWSFELDLMRLLEREPGLRAANTAADSYYQQHTLSPAGRLAQVYQMLSQTDVGVTHLYQVLDSLDAESIILDSAITEADSLLASGTLSAATFLALTQNRNDWSAKLGGLRNEAAGVADQIRQHRTANLQAALTLNNSISTSALYQTCLKQVTGVAIRQLINEGLDADDMATLQYVAAQDSAAGGDAVMLARRHVFEECSPSQRLVGTTPAVLSGDIDTMALYPVPTSDLLNVQISDEQGGEWSMLDLTGRLLLSGQHPKGSTRFEVSVSGISSGAYQLIYRHADGSVSTRLFTVMPR